MRRGVMPRRGLAWQEAEAVDHHVVDVAVCPVLSRLERLDRRMLRPMEVLGRMVIRRGVAAADVSAGHAGPQVDPFAARFQAFLASRAAGPDGRATRLTELLQFVADSCHERLLGPWSDSTPRSPSRSGRDTRRS